MWLPVMDGANKAMKRTPYKYQTKYNGEKTVEAATMMDINKTIMRCLVKNLAMFGLGLYIYAGEDLPETDKELETEVKGPVVVQPVLKADAPAKVEKSSKLPTVETVTKPVTNPVIQFLLTAKAGLAKKRGIDADANHKLFKAQQAALVKAKLAPNKPADEYTMEEATALIEAMEKCFDLNGTELKTE